MKTKPENTERDNRMTELRSQCKKLKARRKKFKNLLVNKIRQFEQLTDKIDDLWNDNNNNSK